MASDVAIGSGTSVRANETCPSERGHCGGGGARGQLADRSDSAERNAIYREMDRLMLAYAPWRLGVHRIFNHLQQPWVMGYKKHPILYTNFKYLDVDVAAQQAGTKH